MSVARLSCGGLKLAAVFAPLVLGVQYWDTIP